MNALAYELNTIPLSSEYQRIPTSEDENPINEKFEFSQARIDSFFNKPSVETEIVDEGDKSTLLSTFFENNNLVQFVPNPQQYRLKTSINTQKWNGYVVSTNKDSFVAILKDHYNKNQDEEVEIPLQAVSQDDLHLVVEGALFDWHMGYEKVSGTTQKYSKILFRRMPRWTKSDFEKAQSLKLALQDFISQIPE